jgi:hypothetical protein
LEKACETAFKALNFAASASSFSWKKTLDWANHIISDIDARVIAAKNGHCPVNIKPVEKILYEITAKYGAEICSRHCDQISRILSEYRTAEER